MNPSLHADTVDPDAQPARPNSALIVVSNSENAPNRCPACGALLAPAATECATCGVDLRAHALLLPSAANASRSRRAPAFAAVLVTGAVLFGIGVLASQQLQAVAPQPAALQQPRPLLVTIYAPAPTVLPAATETALVTLALPPTPVVVATSAIPVIGDPAPPRGVAQESATVPAPIEQKSLVAGRVRALQPKVNVRASARASVVVAIADNGDAIDVFCAVQGDVMPNASGTEWYRVRVTGGIDGWIHASMIDVSGVIVAPCSGR